jgi:hypothetical protein
MGLFRVGCLCLYSQKEGSRGRIVWAKALDLRQCDLRRLKSRPLHRSNQTLMFVFREKRDWWFFFWVVAVDRLKN